MTPAEQGEKAAREENQLRREADIKLGELKNFIKDAIADGMADDMFDNETFLTACIETYLSVNECKEKKGSHNG